tara:strand:- start:226 stop:414 length:189 start_codon:yes stop_codon:yes gene_type:complete
MPTDPIRFITSVMIVNVRLIMPWLTLLYFILKSGSPDSRHKKNINPKRSIIVLDSVDIFVKN